MNYLLVLLSFSTFWALVAIGGCLLAKFFKEPEIIRCCVILTAICCWLIWISTFLMQLNPLIGPRLDQKRIYGMISYWERSYLIN